MYQINDSVVFVRGEKNGAIYDFNTNKVFSVNAEACDLILKLIDQESKFSQEEIKYISLLSANNLYNNNYAPNEYMPDEIMDTGLSLVWLEITQNCNLKCLHCYEGEHHHSSPSEEVMPLSKWKDIIDDLKIKNVERIVVIGGEPCLHKNINEILLHLVDSKINTTLFTNGTLFTEELLSIVIENKLKVKTSLYGHTAAIHDKITNQDGSFDKLVNAIKILISRDVQIDIAVVAMKENQDYLDDIRKFIIALGIKYRKHDIIRNVFGGTQSRHAPDKLEVVKQSKFSNPGFYCSKVQFNKNISQNSCWHGKFAITDTGDVIPCVFERNIKYGNVLKQSIDEILNSIKLKENWSRSFDLINICKGCEFRFACKDCRPLGISVCGDINEKNPRCLYNPYTGMWGE
jgi:radical SAM protein with 4Fe4S-binding SPASM domain